MKSRTKLRNLIFIMIGVFFCAFPIDAKAADYQVRFKFYKIDKTQYAEALDWFDAYAYDYSDAFLSASELTDLSSLSVGDTIAVVPDFRFVGSEAEAHSVSIYFKYDTSVFDLSSSGTNFFFDDTNRRYDPDAVFQFNNTTRKPAWGNDKFSIEESKGNVAITFRDSYDNQFPFDYSGSRKFMFVFLDVKSDPSNAKFIFATGADEEHTMQNPEGGTFETMAAGNDENYVEYPIEVDTEDYIPEITLSTDTTLSALTVMNGATNYTLDPAFSAGSSDTSYTVTVPFSVTSIDLQATPTHTNASILSTELGNKTLSNVGNNSFQFTVTPEDPEASVQIYTINVYRQSNVATLKTLTVGGTTPTGFTADTATTSDLTLPDTADSSVNIVATVTDGSNATITSDSDIGSKTLSVGNNTFTVNVTSEDGTVTNTYTIKIRKKSNVATLSGLTVTSSPQGTMGTFASGTKSYTYTYDETVGNVTITATATDSEAMVKIGSETATKGSATSTSIDPKTTSYVDITVTAEDNSPDSYRITFTKQKSSVNTLSSLSVKDSSNNEYVTSFSSGTKTYNITVPYDVTSLNVSATATSSTAKINNGTDTYTGTMNNLNFTSNTLTLTVTPEQGSNESYTINVTRTKSDNANLTDLQVDGTSITGFDGTQNGTYNLSDVDSTKPSVNVTYTKANTDATVTIKNNGNAVSGNTVNLTEGNNVITVEVKSQDNTKTITHTINIKKKSSVATLSGLTVTSSPQGTMGTFASGTKSYTYTYDESVGNVTINATSTHNEAMVKIGSETASKGSATSTSVDPKTTGSVDIVVTAEDGHSTDTYTINFERKKSNVNTLSSLSVKDSGNNEYITTFSEGQKTYNITVPYDVTSLNVSAAATSSAAKINNGTDTYTGTMNNLNFTSNSLTLNVTPEEGTGASYTINVTRTKSNNANLTDLLVDGTSVTGFNGTQNGTYNLSDVANAKTSVNITYTGNNADATIVIKNNGNAVSGNTVNLDEGNNVITVEVKSQDETNTITHTLNIKRKSSNADLATLVVTSSPQGTLSPSFAAGTITYTYNYDRTVTNINVAATSNHGATIMGDGDYSIPANNKAEITVTPEDGTVKVYTVNFVQNRDGDSSLQSLAVKNGGTTYTLSPAFSSGTKTYSLTVPSEVDKVNVEAIANNIHAKSVTITKLSVARNITQSNEINLDPGSNTVEVDVVAEDDTSTKYTINITRTINNDASLTDLKVDGTTVPEFSSSKTVYNLDAVDYTKSSILIEYTEAAGATVAGDTGTQNLTPGDNKFEITVTSQDGNSDVKYTINIRRKLNDAKITNLTSSSGTTLNAGATEFAYTLDIPSGTTSVSLTPTFMTGATLKTPASLDNIDVTNITDITFEVQAEDTNYTNTYVVTLNKLASTNNDLASLSVDHGTLNPGFSAGTTSYTVTVDSSVDKINVSATVADTGKATVTGTGEYTLGFGDTPITVTVTAEDNSTKDYNIVVTRSESNDTSLSDLTIDGNTIAGFTSTKDTYNISLPYGTTSFALGATPTDSNANIPASELGTKTLSGDTGTFTFVVTAQDNTTKTYTINVTVAGNNDTGIDSLTILSKTPTWNSTENRYELTVDGEVLKVAPADVVATFGNGASITAKDPEMNLAQGANTYKFTVTAADGTTTHEYEVLITREESTINTLATLTSDVGTFTPNFDPDTNIYKLTLPEGTTDFTISATATSKNPATTITGTGNYTIPVTDNKVEVVVTSEDGNVNTYEITIEVEDSSCTLDCDLDGDGECDLNCDDDKDGKCDRNCDTNGDGKCDINCDTNGDKVCDLNCDENGDGVCDYNCDDDGDGTCDRNCRLDKITSSIHTIDDDYVLTVRPETKFDDDFKAQFDNEPTELKLYLRDGTTEVTTQNMATGMILKLERNGTVLDQKALVILGDVNGDGRINTLDSVFVINHYLENDTLVGAFANAADTNYDNRINTLDSVNIINHYLEIKFLVTKYENVEG